MIMGSEVLAITLTQIMNTSINEGTFSDLWKVGIVTLVLKKGKPMEE
jgi:hypothetical protein